MDRKSLLEFAVLAKDKAAIAALTPARAPAQFADGENLVKNIREAKNMMALKRLVRTLCADKALEDMAKNRPDLYRTVNAKYDEIKDASKDPAFALWLSGLCVVPDGRMPEPEPDLKPIKQKKSMAPQKSMAPSDHPRSRQEAVPVPQRPST